MTRSGDTMNTSGENVQIPLQKHCATCVCGEDYRGDGLRLSKFHDAAVALSTELFRLKPSPGQQLNAIEFALETAFRKGVAASLKQP